MQSASDLVEIVTIEKISVIGLLLLVTSVLGWFVWKLQKTIEALRETHRNEIQALNDKHAAKIEELTDRLIIEISKNGIAYQQSANALEMVLKSVKKNV